MRYETFVKLAVVLGSHLFIWIAIILFFRLTTGEWP